jgi:hypothetical protein
MRHHLEGKLVSSRGSVIHGGDLVVACRVGAFSIHGMVVEGASEAPVLRLLGQQRSKLPSLIDAVRNYSVEFSIMARCLLDAPV